MKSKFLKRMGVVGLSTAMIVSSMGVSSFAAVSYQTPTQPMTVNENYIKIAAHAQADVTPEILGITNTTDRAGEVPEEYSLEKAQSSALIGTFGTDINSAPNPFLYNWAYNSYAKENGLALTDKATLGGISGNPNSVDNTIVDSLGTSKSLYYRPEILLGTRVMGAGKTYEELIADLPENTDSDPSNNYDPKIVTYKMSVCEDFLDTLYELADICDQITGATRKVTRYGNAIDVADNLTEYTAGLQAYVLEQLEKNNASKKKVAVIDPINSQDGVFYAVDENTSVQGTTTHSRAGEFVASTTDNIVKVLGKESQTGAVGGQNDKTYYILTAEEIVENSDVIVISGVQNADGDEAQFRELLQQYIDPSKTDLIQKAQTIPMMSTRFSCVGSIGANSIENLLGMAYWTAFIYNEYLNPVYVATYWYQNFYHISDNDMLKTIISTNLASASKPEGVSTDISGYSKDDIDQVIRSGMEYYYKNEDALKDTLIADYASYLTDKAKAEIIESITEYVITAAPAENGTISASAEKAVKGTEVTLTVTPSNGYQIDAVTVKDANNKNVAVAANNGKYSFSMPASDVTASATFKKTSGGGGGSGGGSGGGGGGSAAPATYTITVSGAENGTVTASAEKAAQDTVITLTVAPSEGYEIDSVSVKDSGNNDVELKKESEGKYSFTMPKGNVTVTGVFKKSETTPAGPGQTEPGQTEPGQTEPSASPSNRFRDLDAGAWYKDAVDYVLTANLFNGMSDTEFAPNATMTRAMFVTVLSRLEGIDASQYTGTSFGDVPAGEWYSAAIQWASRNKIVTGVDENTFNPNGNVTREQMAAIMYRYANFRGLGTSGVDASKFNAFTDKGSVSDWAVEAMTWATAKGIINGMGDNTLAPQSTSTRAQVAQIAKNFADNTAA